MAAVRLATGAGATRTEVRTFDTTTSGVLAVSAWLAEQGCTHVAMEATGVYWRPVWHVLSDGDVTLILANAAHVKNVPLRPLCGRLLRRRIARGDGRKTDVADAAWLADLLAHGLIRPSFVPDAPTHAMRVLLRTRKQLVREQASHVQRIQKTLEDANLKLGSVLSDIMGVSGRALLQALIAGETDPETLLGLVHRRVTAPDARFQRLRYRRGPKKAICGVAASILTAVYHMLRNGTPYQDLGADHFHRNHSPQQQANRLVRQITQLGFTYTLTPIAAEPEPVSV